MSTWSSLDPAEPTFGALQFEIGFAGFYDALFSPSLHGVTPELATRTTSYSNHLKTLTIDLRPGVKFQDGTPLDTQAVAFNFRRFQAIAALSRLLRLDVRPRCTRSAPRRPSAPMSAPDGEPHPGARLDTGGLYGLADRLPE